MTEIDLSKYAAGKRLKCVDVDSYTKLTRGKVYESLGVSHEDTRDPNVLIVEDDGKQSNRLVSRFVPVEDEAPESVWRDGVKGERLAAGTIFRDTIGGECTLLTGGICEGQYIRHDDGTAQLRYREPTGRESDCLSTPCRGIREPALSPGHAIREPVRLNEAQREAVGKVDPYAEHRAKLVERLVVDGNAANHLDAAVNAERLVASVMAKEDTTRDYWNPKEPTPREKLIAALRRELNDGSRMKAFPKEGRLCRVYKENDR